MTKEKNLQDITWNNNNQGENIASSSGASITELDQIKAKYKTKYSFLLRFHLLTRSNWKDYSEYTWKLRKEYGEFSPSELDKWQKEVEEEWEIITRQNTEKIPLSYEGETKQDLVLPKAEEILAKRGLPTPESLFRSSELLKKKETSWIVDFSLIRDDEKRGGNDWSSRHKKAFEKYKEGQEKYFSKGNWNRGKIIWELYGENVAAKEVIERLDFERQTILRLTNNYQNEVIQGLEMIKNEREKEQQEGKDEKEAFLKEIKTKNEQLQDKEKELAKANTEGETVKEQLQGLAKNQAEQQAKQAEVLEQNKKALESKERVELTEIKNKYEAELAKAKNQAEQLEIKDKAISNYTRLIYQNKADKEVLQGEYSVLNKKWGILNTEKGISLIEKAQLEQNNLSLNNQIKQKESKLKDWEEAYLKWKGRNDELHERNQKKILEIRDLNKEINDLKFEKLNTTDEINKLKEAKDKEIKRNEELNDENTKLKGGQLYQLFTKIGLNSLWAIASNGVIIVGILLFLYCFSYLWKWVIKPIYRNFRGEKKPKLKETKKKAPTIVEIEEQEEEREEEILKNQSKPKAKKTKVLLRNTKPNQNLRHKNVHKTLPLFLFFYRG